MNEKENILIENYQFKNIIDWLPLVTIVLIVLGYLNQHIFYAQFGIPIYNFINTSEILLLFIPFVFSYLQNIFITLLIVLFFFLFIFYSSKIESLLGKKSKAEEDNFEKKSIDEIREDVEHDFRNFNVVHRISLIRRNFQEIKTSSLKNKRNVFFNITDIFSNLIGICMLTFGMSIWLYFFFDSSRIAEGYIDRRNEGGLLVILMMVFIMSFEIFAFHIINYILSIKNEKAKTVFFLSKIILYIIFFLYSVIIIQTDNIKHGQAEYDISFSYNNKQIKTDSFFVYIGSTQKYIFLREINKKSTKIFKVDSIGVLTVKKIDYSYSFPLFTDTRK